MSFLFNPFIQGDMMNTHVAESTLFPVSELQSQVAKLITMQMTHPSHIVFKHVCIGGDDPNVTMDAPRAYSELAAFYSSVVTEMKNAGLWYDHNNAEDVLGHLENLLFSDKLQERVSATMERYRTPGKVMSFLVEFHILRTKDANGKDMYVMRVFNTITAPGSDPCVQGMMEVVIHQVPVSQPATDLSRLN
jgi:hypothetical protein